MKTKFKGIVWLGVRTEKFKESVHFYKNIMGLAVVHETEDFVALDFENGDRLEFFSEKYTKPDGTNYSHFSTGPVAGFLVDDIYLAKEEMEAEGIEFIGDIASGKTTKWAHFMGVDGNVYELKER